MKYVITEEQNNRIMRLIKQFANSFAGDKVVRTEVEVEYKPENNLYILHPTFYVRKKDGFAHYIYKHILAQRVEDLLGVSVHTSNPIVVEIKD